MILFFFVIFHFDNVKRFISNTNENIHLTHILFPSFAPRGPKRVSNDRKPLSVLLLLKMFL